MKRKCFKIKMEKELHSDVNDPKYWINITTNGVNWIGGQSLTCVEIKLLRDELDKFLNQTK